MFKGCIQVPVLVAASLVATMPASSAANQIEWLCERGEDGSPRAEIVNFGDQWFQINVEQDGCKRSCEQQVKALGLSPDEESKEIQAFAAECQSDVVHDALFAARDTVIALRIADDPSLNDPSRATSQVGDAVVSCLEASNECFDAAAEFDEDSTPELRSGCINACSKAAGACSAVINRGDFTEGQRTRLSAAVKFNEIRSKVDVCSKSR